MTEPTEQAIEERALEMWQQREMDFPPRVRRMHPDALDMASGAWARCLLMAQEELSEQCAG